MRHLFRSVSRLILPAVLSCLALLPIASLHAQEDTYSDPVMEAARAAGLVSEVNQSQTVDGITVTVDWAYADTQRIKLGYTVETAEGTIANDWFSPYVYPKITDDKGANFSFASSQMLPSEAPNKQSFVVDFYTQAIVPIEGSSDFSVNNDYFNPAPEAVNLTFTSQLGGFTVEEGSVMPGSTLVVGQAVEPVGPFEIAFTLPLQPLTVLTPALSVESDGITMTLERVLLTPTRTLVRICYAIPDNRDWLPAGSISMGETIGQISGMSLVGGKNIDFDVLNRCRDLSFDMFYAAEQTSLELNVANLSVSMPEGPDAWNAIKAELAKQNIEIDVQFTQGEQGGGGLNVEVVSIPDGVDYDQAVIEARKALGDWLSGPWNFSVELP